MNIEAHANRNAENIIARLKQGERMILSHHHLDAIIEAGDDYIACNLASAYNRNQVGTLDTFVVWATESARPADIEYRSDMTAIASL